MIWQKIDDVICRYLGIQQERVIPVKVELNRQQIIIYHTSSHKRYLYKQSWQKFLQHTAACLPLSERRKIGIAVGNIIAKQLIVSFEPVKITRGSHAKQQ